MVTEDVADGHDEGGGKMTGARNGWKRCKGVQVVSEGVGNYTLKTAASVEEVLVKVELCGVLVRVLFGHGLLLSLRPLVESYACRVARARQATSSVPCCNRHAQETAHAHSAGRTVNTRTQSTG